MTFSEKIVYIGDDFLYYHRMVAAKMRYCLQHKYTGDMDAAVIFLEESNYHAAQLPERQLARSAVLKFSPKINRMAFA